MQDSLPPLWSYTSRSPLAHAFCARGAFEEVFDVSYLMQTFVAISLLQRSHLPLSKDCGEIQHVDRRQRRESDRSLLSTPPEFIREKIHQKSLSRSQNIWMPFVVSVVPLRTPT